MYYYTYFKITWVIFKMSEILVTNLFETSNFDLVGSGSFTETHNFWELSVCVKIYKMKTERNDLLWWADKLWR